MSKLYRYNMAGEELGHTYAVRSDAGKHTNANDAEAAIAERDAEIKRLRKVVDAALELEYVLRTPEGRSEIDSFTAQPIRIALADMGIDLLEDEEAGR